MKLYSDEELAEILDRPVFHLIGEAADHLGIECYVVGGYVRDIFLERPSNDIDVVVVGSGIELAKEVKKRLGRKAHLSVFKNFGTAQVKEGELELEFVGARRESYSHDSRKPIVEDGTLEDDQNRRDFTINAMAICLNRTVSENSSIRSTDWPTWRMASSPRPSSRASPSATTHCA